MQSFYEWFYDKIIDNEKLIRRFQLVVNAGQGGFPERYTDILCREPNVYFTINQLHDIYMQESCIFHVTNPTPMTEIIYQSSCCGKLMGDYEIEHLVCPKCKKPCDIDLNTELIDEFADLDLSDEFF